MSSTSLVGSRFRKIVVHHDHCTHSPYWSQAGDDNDIVAVDADAADADGVAERKVQQ